MAWGRHGNPLEGYLAWLDGGEAMLCAVCGGCLECKLTSKGAFPLGREEERVPGLGQEEVGPQEFGQVLGPGSKVQARDPQARDPHAAWPQGPLAGYFPYFFHLSYFSYFLYFLNLSYFSYYIYFSYFLDCSYYYYFSYNPYFSY